MRKQKSSAPQWYPEVFRANLIALQENVWHLMMSVICGENYSECFAKLTQDGSWQKMYQGCYQVKMDGFSDEFLGTWPKEGVMYGGTAFLPTLPAPHFGASASPLWPRPIASDSKAWMFIRGGEPQNHYYGCLGEAQARSELARLHVARTERNADGGFVRNDDGLPEALDEIKAYGNAVVPQQFYPIFRAIAEIERQENL